MGILMGWRLGRSNLGRQIHARIDRFLKGLVTIDVEHALIHAGRSFMTTSYRQVPDEGVWSLIVTPKNVQGVHLGKLLYSANKPITITAFEDSEVTAFGFETSIINRNRLCYKTAGTKFYAGATVVNTGEFIAEQHIGLSEATRFQSQGGYLEVDKIFLKPDTIYSAFIAPEFNKTYIYTRSYFSEIVEGEF